MPKVGIIENIDSLMLNLMNDARLPNEIFFIAEFL